jgi:hypothetical protein
MICDQSRRTLRLAGVWGAPFLRVGISVLRCTVAIRRVRLRVNAAFGGSTGAKSKNGGDYTTAFQSAQPQRDIIPKREHGADFALNCESNVGYNTLSPKGVVMDEYTHYTATVRNGTIELDTPVALPDGTPLDILLRVVEPEEEPTPEAQKIEEEMAYFVAHHAELLEQYRGQFVAIHQHEVIDHDENRVELHKRIRQQWGQEVILITPVNAQPIREFRIPGFKLERDK